MSILIDTNVLLRRAQPASPQHQLAIDALQALVVADVEMCLLPQVIYEYWVAATRPLAANGLEMAIPIVEQAVDELLQDFTLLKDERGIFGRWRSLVVAHRILGKNAHDARLVAAMQRHGLTNLMTFNKQDFTGIQVYTPDEILGGQVPA
jgi:predicted nucleic acid-binding protein